MINIFFQWLFFVHYVFSLHFYSQIWLAKRLGYSPSVISAYETGDRTPSVQALIALADVYHVSVDYLLGRSAPRQPQLDLTGLTTQQVAALQTIVSAMRR